MQVTGSSCLWQTEGAAVSVAPFFCTASGFFLPLRKGVAIMMENCLDTRKFLLEPVDFYSPGHLKELFPPDETEEEACLELPQFNAILSYLKPKGSEMKPSVCKMLSQIPDIEDHNKIIMHLSRESNLLYIAAIEGKDRLLLLNCYPANEKNDILYYISMAARQVMFNPPITVLCSHEQLGKDETELLERYFQKVIVAQ